MKKFIFIYFLTIMPLCAQVNYETDIQPIFDLRCTICHGSMGGLNLSSYSDLMNGGISGGIIVPYDHQTSELWIRINSGQMPPGNNDLTNQQIDLIALWIDEGAAEYPSNCNSDLVCDDALTCCDGLLYPTTCCSENCDESIGDCEDEVLLGDINQDGIINVLDTVLIVNIALSEGYDNNADINEDEIINVLDIVLLVNIILG